MTKLRTANKYWSQMFNTNQINKGMLFSSSSGGSILGKTVRYSRQRAQFFLIRTDLGWWVTFFYDEILKRKEKRTRIRLTFLRQFVFHYSFLCLGVSFSFPDDKIRCRLIAFVVQINNWESLVTIFISLSPSRKSIERCKMHLGPDGKIRTAGTRN